MADMVYMPNTNKLKKLSVFAAERGITYNTAWKHWNRGLLKGEKTPTGAIFVRGYYSEDGAPVEEETDDEIRAVIYARVSSPTQKVLLKEQSSRLTNFAIEHGYQILGTVEEIGTGFSDKRLGLSKLLFNLNWDVLIIDNPGVLMKFSYPYVEVLLEQTGRSIVVYQDHPEIVTDATLDNIEIPAEASLGNVITKSRGLMKGMIGINNIRSDIEKNISNLLD